MINHVKTIALNLPSDGFVPVTSGPLVVYHKALGYLDDKEPRLRKAAYVSLVPALLSSALRHYTTQYDVRLSLAPADDVLPVGKVLDRLDLPDIYLAGEKLLQAAKAIDPTLVKLAGVDSYTRAAVLVLAYVTLYEEAAHGQR